MERETESARQVLEPVRYASDRSQPVDFLAMNPLVAGSIAGFVLGVGVGLLIGEFRSPDTDPPPRVEPSGVSAIWDSRSDGDRAPVPGPLPTSQPVASPAREPASAADSGTARAEISGQVRTREGTPVPGAMVYAIRADLPQWDARGGRLGEHDLVRLTRARLGGQDGFSGQDGRFTLFGLVEGTAYRLVAIGRDVGPAALDLFVTESQCASVVTAPARSVEVIDATGSLHVRILPDDSVRARFEDAQGSGITARVQTSADPTAKPARSRSSQSKALATLEFEIRIGLDSAADLTLDGEGIEPVALPSLRVPSGTHVLEVPVSLRGRAVDNRLELEIVDESGAPLPTAAIAILKGIGQPDYPWCSSVQGTEAAQRKLEQGRFFEEHVEPGPTTLRIAAPVALGLAPVEIEFEMPERGIWLRRVVLPKGGKLRIQAENSAMPLFAVRVVAGAPPGTRVLAPITAEGAPMSNGITQYESSVTLVSGHALAPGAYTLLYRSKGVDGAQSFSIRAGEETQLVVR